MRILNASGQPIVEVADEAAAVAWWLEDGREGDHVEGGEPLAALALGDLGR